MKNIKFRPINTNDCAIISATFQEQGWEKPVRQYEQYLRYQKEGLSDTIIAEVGQEIAGYLTIVWQSNYKPFREQAIPEIIDLNVFKKFQRQHIATALMDEAERRISRVSQYAGIGFGIMKDYGAAQVLYIRRGYVPDGRGIVKGSRSLEYGDEVVINDDLVLCLIKPLY